MTGTFEEKDIDVRGTERERETHTHLKDVLRIAGVTCTYCTGVTCTLEENEIYIPP